jgi:hypothetical protein
MQEWGGPVSVAVYIEYKADTPYASDCKETVVAFMRSAVDSIWGSASNAPPISVSFLFAAFDLPDANCDIAGIESGGPRKREVSDNSHEEFAAQVVSDGGAKSHLYELPSVPRHLRNRFERILQTEAEEHGSRGSDSGNGQAIKPLWHMHPHTVRTQMHLPERPWKDIYDEFYPVNALRNLAWKQVWGTSSRCMTRASYLVDSQRRRLCERYECILVSRTHRPMAI